MNDITLKWLGNPNKVSELTVEEKSLLYDLTAAVPDGLPTVVKSWNNAVNDTTFYFGIWSRALGPVGLIGWCGGSSKAEPSWWVHPKYQGCKYASAAVDLLAVAMRKNKITGIKEDVNIEPVYDFHARQTEGDIARIRAQSKALLAHLRKRLQEPWDSSQ